MNKYEIIICWSEEDQAFVAEVPELPGCAAHGPTHEAALASAQEAIRLCLDTARVRRPDSGAQGQTVDVRVIPVRLASGGTCPFGLCGAADGSGKSQVSATDERDNEDVRSWLAFLPPLAAAMEN